MVASFVGGMLEESLREHPSNYPSTVSMNNNGLLLNPDELERQATAVATLADSVEQSNIER